MPSPQSESSLFIYLLLCVLVFCLNVYLSTVYIPCAYKRSEEGVRHPGTVSDRELFATMSMLGIDSGPLEEQLVLLTAESSLQPQNSFLEYDEYETPLKDSGKNVPR